MSGDAASDVASAGTTHDLPLVISWFPTAMPTGPAIGDPERMTWGAFCGVLSWRREGPKDGPAFVPAKFTLERDGRHVRRLASNLTARTAIALDCEINKQTGEIPPRIQQIVERIKASGWAAMVYSSHNHRPEAPRYRIVLPLSAEIDPLLPAPEVVADRLDLTSVLDRGKLTAASVFYLPSAEPDHTDHHETQDIDGMPIDAAWMREEAEALLAERQAEQDRIAAVAHAEAAARRAAKIAAGSDPDDSLIDKLRPHLDLDDELRRHGYAALSTKSSGTKYRHPNSTSGSFGADIKAFSGIERVFSHNATDPLHASNLPAWCNGVTALDVVDVVIILDFGGDRRRALRELADRFGISKTDERSALAKHIFGLIREQAPQEVIESGAYAAGLRIGLSKAEVIEVAQWCATREAT